MNIWRNIALAAVLVIGIAAGYTLRSVISKCPAYTADTTYVMDTVEHHISNGVDSYKEKRKSIKPDTVFVNVPIDTAAVVKAYYSTYEYQRTWQDSRIRINLSDFISMNKPVKSTLSYNLLTPTATITTIKKSTIKRCYLYAGINTSFGKNIPLRASIQLNYASPKALYGAGYDPFNKIYSASFSINLFNK